MEMEINLQRRTFLNIMLCSKNWEIKIFIYSYIDRSYAEDLVVDFN
jgi:hypothetical protein